MSVFRWLPIEETSEAVNISESRLRSLQSTGKLKPGIHWIYLTGTKGGPVRWDPDAIKQWQIDETIRVANGGTAKDIETYED